ncbi:MAG TPA: alpha-amylase family glycosyl hydrolase [Mycobacteriales bacterium]|nr:alpha-amylase family glycosyl hydrolase [Mycobacteriales bacterium]
MSGFRWWQDAVVYHVYPRSFADGNGDGFGDLYGLLDRLDYLAWLGVDAIWIGPIYPSPMVDGGYDVTDHTDVDPRFGDLAVFDRLVVETHRRGLRLLMDWVPNHTSAAHPWFVQSRSSRDNPRRDWYFWRDGTGDRPPNNWRGFRGRPAWTFDERTGQMYLHLFLPGQPDLNWNNPAVVEAMHATLRFWLDRGVDGFRVDVIHCIGKHPDLPDEPAALADVDQVSIHDHDGTHALIRGFRQILDSYPGERMMVGEVTLRQTSAVRRYYGQGDELNLAFNFLSLDAGWDAAEWRELLDHVPSELGAAAWPTWVLTNHDTVRHRTRFGGSVHRARAAGVLLLTLRGTPFLFQGCELGLADAEVPPDRRIDAYGRDGSRAPIPWDGTAGHGWAGAAPPLPFPPGSDRCNVAAQVADPDSVVHLYRRLLLARRGSPALRRGGWQPALTPPGVLGYRRVYRPDGPDGSGTDLRLVLVNFAGVPASVPVDGDWRVEVCSQCPATGHRFRGELGPEQALLLAPAGRPPIR